MSTLVLLDDLAQDLQRDLGQLAPIPATTSGVESFRDEVANLLRGKRAYDQLATVLRQLLDENGFVHLRGFPDVGDLRGIVTLGSLLGELFADMSHQATLVLEASPVPGATLQGNRTGALFPHTDFAMLERPPAVTVLRCATEDPLGAPFGVNGVMLAQHVIDHFFGAEWLPSLWTVPLPFAGRKPSGEDVVFSIPVLDVEPGSLDVRSVRFHPSRVHHGFRVRTGRDTGGGRGAAPSPPGSSPFARRSTWVRAITCSWPTASHCMIVAAVRSAWAERACRQGFRRFCSFRTITHHERSSRLEVAPAPGTRSEDLPRLDVLLPRAAGRGA